MLSSFITPQRDPNPSNSAQTHLNANTFCKQLHMTSQLGVVSLHTHGHMK